MSNTPSTVSTLIKVLKVEQVHERELIASNELLVRKHIELHKQHLAKERFNEFIKNRQLLHHFWPTIAHYTRRIVNKKNIIGSQHSPNANFLSRLIARLSAGKAGWPPLAIYILWCFGTWAVYLR